jgi:hypothetical protein
MVRHMNNIDNIDKIRKEAISKIKEKIKKNPGHCGYLHPCNKERLEDMKTLGFQNGNNFTHWMQQNRIMKNPANAYNERMEKIAKDAGCKTSKEHLDNLAKNAGFKDNAERKRERLREWTHDTGICLPYGSNEDCPTYFGEFAESLMIMTFLDPVKMPYGNPGFDWKCNNGDKIDNKAACLSSWNMRYSFPIRRNKIADWFILSAWDNRDSLNPLHVWAFHKNDIVRGRKFCERISFSIANTPKGLEEFEKYEVSSRLKKLKELCNKKREIK